MKQCVSIYGVFAGGIIQRRLAVLHDRRKPPCDEVGKQMVTSTHQRPLTASLIPISNDKRSVFAA